MSVCARVLTLDADSGALRIVMRTIGASFVTLVLRGFVFSVCGIGEKNERLGAQRARCKSCVRLAVTVAVARGPSHSAGKACVCDGGERLHIKVVRADSRCRG